MTNSLVAPVDLPAKWRAESLQLRDRYSDERAAHLFQTLADELSAALASEADAILSLVEASRESGYSESHLSRLILAGDLPTAGRKHSPAIRRADLPRKPGHLHIQPSGTLQIARSIVGA